MEAANNDRVMYEARRQARGGGELVRGRGRRRWLVWVLVVTCAIVGGVVWWVVWTIGHVTTARATVRARVVTVSAVADGRVEEVRVKAGQKVTEGGELGRLEDLGERPELAAAAVEEARARVEMAEAGVASAEAALAFRKAQLALEIERAQAEGAQAQARLAYLLEGARSEAVETAKAQLATAKAMVELSVLELAQSKLLHAEGVESEYTLEAKKTQLAIQRNKVREAELALAEMEAGPVEQEVEISRRDVAAREAELELARVGDKAVEALAPELATRKAQLREAQAALAKAEARVEGMTLLSPVAGTVIRTYVSVGEVCRKGEAFASVADEAAGLWIEGYVWEVDAHRVKAGQRARVEIVVGSGRYVEAEVTETGATTTSVYDGGGEGKDNPDGPGVGELVWVKLRPVDGIGETLAGMSARVVIDVR